MSREGPEPVAPVEMGGIRYEAIHWGKVEGLGQNGGHVRAFDQASGKELWTLKLYDIDYEQDMEPDRLDVFITSLAPGEDGDSLIVEDENGRRFRLDLASREVEQLS